MKESWKYSIKSSNKKGEWGKSEVKFGEAETHGIFFNKGFIFFAIYWGWIWIFNKGEIYVRCNNVKYPKMGDTVWIYPYFIMGFLHKIASRSFHAKIVQILKFDWKLKGEKLKNFHKIFALLSTAKYASKRIIKSVMNNILCCKSNLLVAWILSFNLWWNISQKDLGTGS